MIKAYVSKQKAEDLARQGLQFITKVRKNMRQKMLTAFEKFFLSKRGIVETVIDQLKAICQIEHSRHRSPANFISNLLAALAAYVLKPRKPSLKFNKSQIKMAFLTSN